MLLTPEAFMYVPMLTGKILEPEKSTFRISRETFAEWDKRGRGWLWRKLASHT